MLAAVCGVLTAVALVAAIVLQRQAATPIGEGEVFLADARAADGIIVGAPDLQSAVSLVRNELDIEAVSIIDDAGTVVASTSPSLVGSPAHNQLIANGADEHRFMAVADAIDEDLVLDDVVEWPAGSILYQVVSPLDDGRAILLHYDVSELLGRRSQPGEIPTESIQLLGLAGLLALIGAAVMVGHSRATRRHREMERESELLRAHSEALEAANEDLDRARHQAEEALALAEEKIRIRSEFVLMINHELRTPLTSVVTGAELLRSTELSNRDREIVLDSMVADGARLQEIIDQILAVARIENRGLSYELADVGLHDLTAAVASAHPAGTPVTTGANDPAVVVRTDLNALSLVVASLVDNAMTHGATRVTMECSTDRGIDPDLEVGRRPDHALHVIIADNGPGIDARFLPRIFEKFEKSSFSSGTGLGLYLVRMVVESIDGSLAVETSPRGTTFQISLPTVQARHPVRSQA